MVVNALLVRRVVIILMHKDWQLVDYNININICSCIQIFHLIVGEQSGW